MTTSVYLEEHKGMDWRLQQLGYQLPEQDERLLADNPHLSNELKFLRTQQKLCSIPVKLYLNNDSIVRQCDQTSVNSVNESASKLCNRCEQVINKGTYCVQADLSNLNLVLSKTNNQQNTNSAVQSTQSSAPVHVYFHIDCLQCVTCSEILVDFRAFIDPRTQVSELSAGKLNIYCSRHFLELFKPRCEFCEELIFDKKCTQAEGRAWHVMHFSCYQCKLPLGGQQYKMADLNQKEERSSLMNGEMMRLKDLHKPTTKDIHPFCLACCDQLFGEYCARCEKLITCDQNPVKFEKYFWHATPECFSCNTCGITLVNSDYLPSSSAKQIFCSAKCAQSLQAKDLINLNSGLMKLNDRLRNSNSHKPTLNSVQEEDDCVQNEDELTKSSTTNHCTTATKVEYENSSMFHLASNNKPLIKDENVDTHSVHYDSPTSNRSSSRSLSSLSLLSNSSPDTPERSSEETSTSIKEAKNRASIESICSTESNQLNSSTTTTIAKEIESTDSEQVLTTKIGTNSDENVLDKQSDDARPADHHQKLIPCVIVNNNPFTRTSIIIDNLNSTLSTMQILDDEFIAPSTGPNDKQVINSSLSSNDRSVQSLQNAQNEQTGQNGQSSSSSPSSLSGQSRTSFTSESIVNGSNSQVIYSVPSKVECPKNDSSPVVAKATSSNGLENSATVLNRETIENMFNSVNQPTHYSTLPTRKTQRTPKVNFNFEEPGSTMQPHYEFSNDHFVGASFPVRKSSHQSINVNSKPVDSMNEIGLPVPINNKRMMTTNINQQPFDNLLNFVNCTLPRSNRNRQSTADGYLNGIQSVSISKLNATMLQTKFNRYNNSCNNLSINNSTNSEFSNASSSKQATSSNNMILNNNVNSHSVVVSEGQIESLNTKLVVKPLSQSSSIVNKPLARTPPLPPVEHGFIKKWSTTNSNSTTGMMITSQLSDLPVIQEHHLVVTNNQSSSERTSSATPSLGSSIQSNDINETNEKEQTTTILNNNNNLISMQNFTSSNNSLNAMIQTNLNSSNSASLISATSSISSTMSSNETTPQLHRSLNHHNRPDVILNPIETIKQLKQKQRELKLKEKMLKKAEQQSIDQKPKIIEEQLKASPPTGKQPEQGSDADDEVMERKELLNNTRKMSTEHLQLTRLKDSVSNSLSSLTISRTAASRPLNDSSINSKNELMKKQQKSTNHLLPTYRSQPNLHCVQTNSSNGETSNASTPDQLNRLEQLSQITHLNQLNQFNQLSHLKESGLNQSPSSQYSPSINDTDSSSVMNSVEMDNIVQFTNLASTTPIVSSSNTGDGQIQHTNKQSNKSHQQRQPQSSLKDTESQSNLKQKSVSFDPNVIEKENSKAPKRLSRKAMNGHNYRYPSGSSKKKYHQEDSYESQRRKKNYQRDHHHGHYKTSSRRQRRHHHHYEEDDFCSTCSSSSYSSSSSFCSSSDEEDRGYLYHGRKGQNSQFQQQSPQPKSKLSAPAKQNVDKLSQLTSPTTGSIAPEQMVKIMQQQQLIIQQQLAQMQPQLKQQRYLRNNTNESCVIS